MRLLNITTFLTILIFMFYSCSETNETPVTESNNPSTNKTIYANHGDCLGSGLLIIEEGNDETIIEFSYGNKVLSIDHLNAGFNCCFDKIKIDYELNNGIITISETDINPVCDCLCLYNIDYEFTDIEPGIYTIKIIESMKPEADESIIFKVELKDGIKGIKRFKRSGYPWGIQVNRKWKVEGKR